MQVDPRWLALLTLAVIAGVGLLALAAFIRLTRPRGSRRGKHR